MDRHLAEENLKVIREVMERSARYTHFSGLSGVISGLLALMGCAGTWLIYEHIRLADQNLYYILTWCAVLVLAIAEDLLLAHLKARASGQSIWNPATYQVLKAVFPGVFVAAVISFVALYDGAIDAIPAIWALGYGSALCAAGMFTVKEVWRYGVLQMITGTVGLFLLSTPPYSLCLVALTFGVYQIAFGLWMTEKYR